MSGNQPAGSMNFLAQALEWIEQDLWHWPGARSIDAYFEDDTFEPTTLAVLRDTFGSSQDVAALVAKAETAAWSQRDAMHLMRCIAAMLAGQSPDTFEAKLLAAQGRQASNSRRGKERRLELVNAFEAARARLPDDRPDEVLAKVRINGKPLTEGEKTTARKALRELGLFPQKGDKKSASSH